MSKLLYFIKRHNSIKDFLKILIALFYFPLISFSWVCSFFFVKLPSDLWLVGELGIDAKDNGFAFFKYLNINHPEINSFYYISTSSSMYYKVKKIGNTVEYNSFLHMIIFMKSKYILSTQDSYPLPWGKINWREFKLVYPWIANEKKFIFLQHGIIKDDASRNSNYNRTKFDYFVTSVQREYDEISSPKYGYKKSNVIKTGLPRFDNLYDNLNASRKNEILLMPTWRQYLANVSVEQFKKSDYYRAFNDLFNNKRIINLLRENNLILSFFPPHREIQKFLSEFKTSDGSVVRMIDVDKESVSKLIIESKLMITDYSSVAFDFAFMKKPVIYYQFDQLEFRKMHYREGYFSYNKDGMGPVVINSIDLISEVENNIKNNFNNSEKYKKRNEVFFDLRDNKNSERLYDFLIRESNSRDYEE
ncbi:CDP-glycerol glycerophosphotransferase family protein [Leuconostoc gelidum]|uniref:CDP-glycerol glycerophosphotransferase family protein n=1 Tax=Leuconostoc gelidum TaxID=1244 RepID=UPI001C7D1DF0|nr:CDP-glycerol glycerophosphotransferase family protein [Leuconostoc gelidum]MBZ6010603.1 CDP-glycerol glycerophosphotransferase family protein [Leuconostoc gelidum subsp. aenigmaticum]